MDMDRQRDRDASKERSRPFESRDFRPRQNFDLCRNATFKSAGLVLPILKRQVAKWCRRKGQMRKQVAWLLTKQSMEGMGWSRP